MINQVLIATASNTTEADAKDAINNRSLLYNKDKKKLFVKYDDQLNPIGANPDNHNIIENEDGDIALKPIPNINGVTIVQPGGDPWRGQRLLGNISANKNIILFFPKNESNNYIGGEILQKGANLHGHYETSFTSTGSRSFKGACTDAKKANLIMCTYQGATWYGIRFYSTVSSKVFFSGWYTRNPIITGGSNVSDIVDLNDNADTGTVIINGGGGRWTYEFDTYNKDLATVKNHANYKIDERATIVTNVSTVQRDLETLYDSQGRPVNIGCFEVQAPTTEAKPIFRFTIKKRSSIYVSFTSLINATVNVTLSYQGGSISASSTDPTSLVTLDKILNENEGPFTIWADNSVRIWTVSWTESSTLDTIIDEIEDLPETGPNGAPHIVTFALDLYKADLIKISEACQNSNVQMIIDLSQCTCKGDGINWSADKNTHARCLNSLFSGCRSLRGFAFPKGVSHAGGFTFQNCPFLEKVVIPDDLQMFGLSNWTDVNTGFLQGTGVPKLWLPKAYGSFKGNFEGFAWAGCQAFDVYWPPESWLKNNWTRDEQFTNLFIWSYFAYADERLKFYMPCHKLPNGQWDLNDGELYSIAQRLGNHDVSSAPMDLPSNKYAFKPKKFKAMCIPYDIDNYETMRALDSKLY